MTYKLFDENKVGSDYVVSDIHGCYSLLGQELDKIGFNSDVDRLFCVGDLTDRGPENEKCLEWLAKPGFFSIKGNHEDMIIKAFGNRDIMVSMDFYAERNGNAWWLELPREEQKVYVEAFYALPNIIEVSVNDDKRVGLVHAEVPIVPGNSWLNFINTKDQHILTKMLWGRDIVYCQSSIRKNIPMVEGIDLVIHGHSVVDKPRKIANRLYIDTGAVSTGKFTILKLKDLV